MRLLCWECWLLTLTKCSYSGREARRIPRCYRSAIQHAKEPVTTHLCEDHALADPESTHTLLGLGRYRIPTKLSWVLLLLLLKFLVLPACGIELDILPFVQISR